MRKVKKTFKQKREELRQALYILDGALKRYGAEREIAELGTVVITLRGLLCGEALLFSLAESKGFPLELYTLPAEFRKCIDNVIKEKSSKHYIAVPITDSVALKSNPILTHKVSIKEWLNMPIMEIDGVQFSAKNLINEIANTTGPAHHLPEISRHLLKMNELKLSSGPSQFRTLLNFSKIVLELGNKFIDSYRGNDNQA